MDEWGRSEHLRELARRLYDPIYRQWFRAEWEGLEKIPQRGGALIVANHAGAIPSDAPVIMHGIETELQRPVYGLADHLFKSLPVIGTIGSRQQESEVVEDLEHGGLEREVEAAIEVDEVTKRGRRG